MNRAWIPAGALAGVSVAGLLALGPLTDSMGTQVAFPTTVPTQKSSPGDFLPVSVRLSRGTVGQVTTIGLKRGGQATTTASSNSSEGFVGFRKSTSTRPSTATATATTTHATAKPKKSVKPAKRQGSIGGPGETNSSAGLASGSGSGPRGLGEQQSTLSGDGN
jgi:hypothetical protein